jgi:hypothetical protein
LCFSSVRSWLMPTFNKLPSGYWRVQIRRKRYYASRTFRLKRDAEIWVAEAERSIELGKGPTALRFPSSPSLGDLIGLHIDDHLEVGKQISRTKLATPEELKSYLGATPVSEITRTSLVEFGKRRARQGAGPVTIGMDLGYIRTILVPANPWDRRPGRRGGARARCLATIGPGEEEL